jgi:hypothetical protein
VVTYGRSGSTLLMGLLNSIPGYLVRGENWDALHHLFRFHRTLVEGSQRWEPARMRQRTHPFFGAADFPARRSLDGIRTLVLDTVLRPRDDTRVPGARFVVNTRDHEGVLRSGWWAKRPELAESLPAVEARILALAEGLGDAAYRVHYNDYVAEPSVLRGLFEWLGEAYDEAAVRAVLETRHSV